MLGSAAVGLIPQHPLKPVLDEIARQTASSNGGFIVIELRVAVNLIEDLRRMLRIENKHQQSIVHNMTTAQFRELYFPHRKQAGGTMPTRLPSEVDSILSRAESADAESRVATRHY